jgi:myosin heavy subunit
MMDVLYLKVLERNARETKPFVLIHEAHATLLNQFDALKSRCDLLEREVVSQQHQLKDFGPSHGSSKASTSSSAALKTETRLRDKLEKLQEELNAKLEVQADEQEEALRIRKELAEIKALYMTQTASYSKLEEESERKEKAIDHMTMELNDAKSRTKLAEQQYMGLKDTIRALQEENDQVKKQHRELEIRFVTEKTQLSDEMNSLTDIVESLKKELDLLRTLKVHEEKGKSWFGYSATSSPIKDSSSSSNNKKNTDGGSHTLVEPEKDDAGRKWGDMRVVLPSHPIQVLQAHASEASCVRWVMRCEFQCAMFVASHSYEFGVEYTT